jgi:zinc transporter, ZIP family
VTAGAVFLAALATAVATGLGAIPFLFLAHPSRSSLGIANSLAAGAMTGASAGLVWEGWQRGPVRVLLGLAAGAVVIAAGSRLLKRDGHQHFGSIRGTDAVPMLLIVGVMTIHSFAEGIGVGVAFGDGQELGLVIAIAIALHNVPEGLAISLVLVPRGISVGRAAAWSVFTSLPQPLMAVPAFVFVESFEQLLPVGLGFAAGAMAWMVASDLVPDAVRVAPLWTVALVGMLAAAAMVAFQASLL